MDESHTVIQGTEGAAIGGPELTRGTLLAGRYEIGRRLGQGGVGVVVQARDRALGEEVAVKVLRPEHGGEARRIERLAKEVKLARQIGHPNVCRVFDFGQADGHAFLVMELARGSLRDELARDAIAARPLAMRLADARAVAQGLAAVHAAGIVHRDVTPQNVLRMSDGRLAVSDFGLATDADPTATSIHGGTVAYMAPEIARGERATLASDVWALGVILHEIVFGRRPSWRVGRFRPIMQPTLEAALGPAARRIVEICVQCTGLRPRRRPTAEQVGRLIARAAEAADARAPRWRRALPVAAAALLVAAGALGPRRSTTGAPAADRASSLALSFEGSAADWKAEGRLLATVDGQINGLTVLPGGARVRVVWGEPPHSEDVDLATGARSHAALPPLPARAGTPVPSPDGSALACEGYDGGRPFVFLGPARGSAPLAPVVAAADPSVASQPRWLADGHAFVYDADARNVGVFSLDTNRTTILPAFDGRPSFTTFKAVVRDRVLVNHLTDDLTSQIAIFSWPDMTIAARFDVPGFAVEWQSSDGLRLYGIVNERDQASQIVAVDLAARRARRLGRVPGNLLRAFAPVGDTLVFATAHFGGDVWLETNGVGRLVTLNLSGREVARAAGHVLVTIRRDGLERILELDEEGRERRWLTVGPIDESPSILPSGRAWTYVRRGGDAPGYYRCEFDGGCVRVLDLILPYATVSPEGTLVAYVDPAPHGPRARLVALAGGSRRELGDASSFCAPVWSSSHTLWISRRTEGAPIWVELDVATPDVRPTGRTRLGTRACTDGLPDPAAPIRDGAKIVVNWKSELRLHALP